MAVSSEIDKGEESVIRHSPPEVKGPILNKLLYDYWLTPQWLDGTRTQVSAVASILKTFQSARDFEETLMRMNPDGHAVPGEMAENGVRVFRFIGRNRHYYERFREILRGTTPQMRGPVQLDPYGACRSCGVA